MLKSSTYWRIRIWYEGLLFVGLLEDIQPYLY